VKIAMHESLLKARVGSVGPKIWQKRETPLGEWLNCILGDLKVGKDEVEEIEMFAEPDW